METNEPIKPIEGIVSNRSFLVPFLAILVVGAWLAIDGFVVVYILSRMGPEGLSGEAGLLLGKVIQELASGSMLALAYYWGSSKKDEGK